MSSSPPTSNLALYSGRNLRGEFRISRSVIRVGSLATCDVLIPELEPHAITVETRQGRQFVHNRTARHLMVGPTALSPDGSSVWDPGTRLQLRSELFLVIRETLPAGTRPARKFSRVRVANIAPGPGPEVSGPGRMGALVALTLACLVVSVWILRPMLGDNSAQDDDLRRLISDLQAGRSIHQAVALELQLAEQEQWLDRDESARAHLGRARALIDGDDPDRDGGDPTEARVRQMAQRWLAGKLR